METLEQVRESAPAAPSKINPRVPRDLEVICLKCLEKDPARRYASAPKHWPTTCDDSLQGRADPARDGWSAGERAWRWCERNPWLAGLSAALLVRAGGGAIVASVLAVRQPVVSAEKARTGNRPGQRGGRSGQSERRRAQDGVGAIQQLASQLKTSLEGVERPPRHAPSSIEARPHASGEQIGPGLLSLVESWRLAAEAGDAALQHAARRAWPPTSVTTTGPRWVTSARDALQFWAVAFSPDGKTVLTGSGAI